MATEPALPRSFYERPTLVVARDLLGHVLTRKTDGETRRGIIVEVEAYVGGDDVASHASRGETDRTRIMFGPAGHAYVYLIYGMYNCLNVVTERVGFPAAILIRALEPIDGIEAPTNGPGRLCKAMHIDRALNGVDMTRIGPLCVEAAQHLADPPIAASPRIGVDYAGESAAYPWRFFVAGNPHVSRPPRAPGRA